MEWDDITRLVELFKENELTELEFSDDRFSLRLAGGSTAPAGHALVAAPESVPAVADSTEPEPAPEPEGRVIESPFVGTFYRQPSPDAPPYVELGQRVTKGQVLCIVEAMKLMNEIEADVSGRIAKIYVENGKPVEYSEALFLIEPN